MGIYNDKTHSLDAFGRLRTSALTTLFDSKQTNDNQPLLWDDQETSGSGTSSTYSSDLAASTMGVSASTAGTRVRQTFLRFNYQPGKSQMVILSGKFGTGVSGVTKRLGYFDDDNGLFWEQDGTTLNVVRRTKTSGSAVDNEVAQSNWNIDPLDGTGASGVNLDVTKVQVFFLDFEWLGTGRARMGFFIDGRPVYCHEFLHANKIDTVFMSNPNLPVRYEISNSGSGAASELVHICATVASEGGKQEIGITRHVGTQGTHVDANVANTVYAILGIRLKAANLSGVGKIIGASVLNQTADDFEYIFILNPTVADTFTYSDQTNSVMQVATGVTANTVTGGTHLGGGFVKASGSTGSIHVGVVNELILGAAIDGTRDELVLCVRPLSANANIEASLTWREI